MIFHLKNFQLKLNQCFDSTKEEKKRVQNKFFHFCKTFLHSTQKSTQRKHESRDEKRQRMDLWAFYGSETRNLSQTARKLPSNALTMCVKFTAVILIEDFFSKTRSFDFFRCRYCFDVFFCAS